MPAKRRPDLPDEWRVMPQIRDDHIRNPVELAGGGLFPERVGVIALPGREEGIVVSLQLAVHDGRPVLTGAHVSAGDDHHLSPSQVREVPWGALFERAVAETAALSAVLMRRRHGTNRILQAQMGGLSRTEATELVGMLADPTANEIEDARRAALNSSRRGRPVGDDTLRRVGKIVAAHPRDYREVMRDEFAISLRTASRWVKQAKDMGYDGNHEEDSNG